MALPPKGEPVQEHGFSAAQIINTDVCFLSWLQFGVITRRAEDNAQRKYLDTSRQAQRFALDILKPGLQ